MLADPGAVVVRPQALTLHAATSMIREALERDVDVEFADACHEATGGNPLLLRAARRTRVRGSRAEGNERVARLRDRPGGGIALGAPPASRLPHEATRLARASRSSATTFASWMPRTRGARPRPGGAHGGDAADAERHPAPRARSLVRAPWSCAPPSTGAEPVGARARHRQAAGLPSDAGAATEKVAAHLPLTAPARSRSPSPSCARRPSACLRKGDLSAAGDYLRRAIEEIARGGRQRQAPLQLRLLAERLVDSPLAAEHLREAHDLTDDASKGEVALELGRTLFYSMWVEEAVGVLEAAIAGRRPEPRPAAPARGGPAQRDDALPLYPLAASSSSGCGPAARRRPRLAHAARAPVAGGHALAERPLEVCVANAERAVAGGALFAQDNAAFAFSTVTLTTADRSTTRTRSSRTRSRTHVFAAPSPRSPSRRSSAATSRSSPATSPRPRPTSRTACARPSSTA